MLNIEQLENAYREYNSILAQYNHHEVIENKKEVVIKVKEIADNKELRSIISFDKYFKAYINPFSDSTHEVISNIEAGVHSIEEIDSVTFSYDKPLIENIDEIYFRYVDSILDYSDSIETNVKKSVLLLDLEEFIETETIKYISLDEAKVSIPSKIDIDKESYSKIIFYVSVNKKESMTFFRNPFSYRLVNENENENENEKPIRTSMILDLKRLFYTNVLKTLSDKNDSNGFLIRGEKSINLLIDKNFKVDGIDSLEKILDFLVTEKKYTEKFLIIKNVLSLYLNDNDDITILDEKLKKIWKTVDHYYNHYIEDDIKDFFKTKDELLKEAMGVSKVVYEQTDKINTTIFASLFSVLALVFTTVIRSISDLTHSNMYTLFSIVLVFSIIFYWVISSSSKKRYNLSKDQFEYFIEEVTIIQDDEIKKIKEIYLTNPYEALKNTLGKLLIFLIISNYISLVILILFVQYY